MKVNFLILVVSAIFLSTACADDSVTILTEPDPNTIPNVKSDGELFDILVGDRSEVTSDPFVIRSSWREGDVLFVVVQYSGGCENHDFDFVWSANIDLVPEGQVGFDQTSLIIIHNANGDMCEAALTDTLTVDLADIGATINLDQLNTRIMNGGSDQTFSVVQGFTGIPEDETCEYEVVLTEVICGDGLFDNKWFRFTGKEEPAFLQPVALMALIELPPDQPIGRYKVGVKVGTWTPDPDKAICLAYPGPSIPVEIWCLELIEEGEF